MHPSITPSAVLRAGEIFPRLQGVRALLVLVMAFGYSSTMARGPEAAEFGRVFGFEPSLFALKALFCLSGYLAMRSLARHGSAWALLATRARRNLVPLAIVTAAVAFAVYPLIREDTGMGTLGVWERLNYLLSTVSCTDPGQVMPGALDTAHYQCLLQGSVWTFRWGAVAYIGCAVLHKARLLRSGTVLAALAVLSPAAYALLQMLMLKGSLAEMDSLLAGLRLGYPFVLGMAAHRWRALLPRSLARQSAWVATGMGVAAVNYAFLPWTPLIEVASTGAVSAAVLFAVRSRHRGFAWLENWPALALPLFLLNWPVAQLWLYLLPGVGSGALVALTLGSSGLTALLIAGIQSKAALSPPPLSQANRPRTA